jgi:hypothetical protein
LEPIAWRLAKEASDPGSWTVMSAVLADGLDREQSAAVAAALSNADAFAAIVAQADRERVLPALHLALTGRFDTGAKFWRAVVAKAYQENRQRNANVGERHGSAMLGPPESGDRARQVLTNADVRLRCRGRLLHRRVSATDLGRRGGDLIRRS